MCPLTHRCDKPRTTPTGLPVIVASIPTCFCLVLGCFSMFCLFVFGGIGIASNPAFSENSPFGEINEVQVAEMAVLIVISILSFLSAVINAINDRERIAWRTLTNSSCLDSTGRVGEAVEGRVKNAKKLLIAFLVLSPIHSFVETSFSSILLSIFAAIAMIWVFYGLISRNKKIVEYAVFGMLCHVMVWSLMLSLSQMTAIR